MYFLRKILNNPNFISKCELNTIQMLKVTNDLHSNPKIDVSVKIPTNGNYDEYVNSNYSETTEFLICPTDAIDIQKFKIDNQKCIECLLCPYLSSSIKFEESKSFETFLNYTKSDKKFLTMWIGQSVKVSSSEIQCAFEVKVTGGSRAKRIPLFLNIEGKIVILKVVDSYKDIEYGLISLEETENLIKSHKQTIPKKIIVPNESKEKINEKLQQTILNLKQNHNFDVVSIDSIWNTLKNGISEKQINWKDIFFPKED